MRRLSRLVVLFRASQSLLQRHALCKLGCLAPRTGARHRLRERLAASGHQLEHHRTVRRLKSGPAAIKTHPPPAISVHNLLKHRHCLANRQQTDLLAVALDAAAHDRPFEALVHHRRLLQRRGSRGLVGAGHARDRFKGQQLCPAGVSARRDRGHHVLRYLSLRLLVGLSRLAYSAAPLQAAKILVCVLGSMVLLPGLVVLFGPL